MTASQRETPWTLNYADGAANAYRFSQSEAGGAVSFEYVPVTPAQSSTGTYSGGEPRSAELSADDPRIAALWRRVEALEADTASHGPDRNKGTGAFSIKTPAGERAFIVEQGAVLDEIHAFMKGFRD
jgi:hypothetical protein